MIKSTIDMTAAGLILINIFLFFFIIGIVNIITKIVGIIGAITIIIVEGYFLLQKWRR